MSVRDRFLDDLEDYLNDFDGNTPLPARVRDAIRAELPGTRQARPVPGQRRLLIMLSSLSRPARVAAVILAVVALLVVVAAGGALIGGRPATVAPPPTAATPSPAPSPSAAPSIAAGPPTLDDAQGIACSGTSPQPGCIAAGPYSLNRDEFPVAITLEVPGGWAPYDPGLGMQGLLSEIPADAPDGSGWGIWLSTVGSVSRDPCDRTVDAIPASELATPEAVAAVMAAWPGFHALGDPTPIEIGGASGVRIDIVSEITSEQCSARGGTADGILWRTHKTTPFVAYPMLGHSGEVGRLPGQYLILDVGDDFVIINHTDFADSSPFEEDQGVARDPQRHAGEHQTELRAIVQSIRFGEPTT